VQPNWAEENLQVIRTLMERAGLYRRALAPVMLAVGLVGVGAVPLGLRFCGQSLSSFINYWSVVCLVAVAIAIVIIRRQAIRSSEPFWSAPTRRVASAMLPALIAGAAVPHVLCAVVPEISTSNVDAEYFIPLWLLFYGCALHSAGLFISKGTRWLGWMFIVIGIFLFALAVVDRNRHAIPSPHMVMGATFGGLHFLAAAYLYFTEKKEPTP